MAEGADFLAFLGRGSVGVSSARPCLEEAFRLLGIFVGDGLKEGRVEANWEIGKGGLRGIFGSGKGLSSEDSENTGVPCLKEVFSVSLSEELSKEESISSITGEDCFAGRGLA